MTHYHYVNSHKWLTLCLRPRRNFQVCLIQYLIFFKADVVWKHHLNYFIIVKYLDSTNLYSCKHIRMYMNIISLKFIINLKANVRIGKDKPIKQTRTQHLWYSEITTSYQLFKYFFLEKKKIRHLNFLNWSCFSCV